MIHINKHGTLARFVEIINATPLLTAEAKQEHLARASSYSPEMMAKVVEIIQEEEKNFLVMVEKKRAAKAEEMQKTLEDEIKELKEKEAASNEEDAALLAALQDEVAHA